MHYLAYTVVAWALVYFLAGGRFFRLWKAALIGVVIEVAADYLGTKYNFYFFPKGIIYLGKLPLFHVTNTYAASILYLNWLPGKWNRRLLYTIYVSALYLAVEAAMFRAGAIAYANWKLWYSYLLLFGGLSLMAWLADLLKLNPKPVYEKLSGQNQ